MLTRNRLRGSERRDCTSLVGLSPRQQEYHTRLRTSAGATECRPGRWFVDYGVVALSEKVSVLLYVPARSTSPAPMAWRKPTVTRSPLTGPV